MNKSLNKSLVCAALLSALSTGAVLAQDAAQQPQPQPDRRARMEDFNKRFTEADANGDGKLTRDEAKDKMPGVYSHFDDIDVDKKGYLTKQDIAKSMRKMGAGRRAQQGTS